MKPIEEFRTKLLKEAERKIKNAKKNKQFNIFIIIAVLLCTSLCLSIVIFYDEGMLPNQRASITCASLLFFILLLLMPRIMNFLPLGKIAQKKIQATYKKIILEMIKDYPEKVSAEAECLKIATEKMRKLEHEFLFCRELEKELTT